MKREIPGSNILNNGLTLLQTNPDRAVSLNRWSTYYGWLFVRGGDGQWVTYRKLSDAELEKAIEQSEHGIVMYGTKIREG